MLERFLKQTHFASTQDFAENYHVQIPENFNFGYDVVDEWAKIDPTKRAICWVNDQGEHIDFTFADIKNKVIVPRPIFNRWVLAKEIW